VERLSCILIVLLEIIQNFKKLMDSNRLNMPEMLHSADIA